MVFIQVCGQIHFNRVTKCGKDFPGGSHGKASVYNVGDLGSIPGSGRSPGEGNGNPLQDYCLENPMHRGAWQATVHGVAKSRTRLSDFTFTLDMGGWNSLWNLCFSHLTGERIGLNIRTGSKAVCLYDVFSCNNAFWYVCFSFHDIFCHLFCMLHFLIHDLKY